MSHRPLGKQYECRLSLFHKPVSCQATTLVVPKAVVRAWALAPAGFTAKPHELFMKQALGRRESRLQVRPQKLAQRGNVAGKRLPPLPRNPVERLRLAHNKPLFHGDVAGLLQLQ